MDYAGPVDCLLVTDERPIKLMIVDDDQLTIRGLSNIVQYGAKDIELVGAANDGGEAIAQAVILRPDVILMDVVMKKMNGIEATRRIRSQPGAPEIIVLTTFDADGEPLKAIEAGAAGFLLKSEDPERILDSIREVAAGEGALSPRTAKQMVAHVRAIAADPQIREAVALVRTLTEREREVADAVTAGMSNAEIAKKLFVSDGTVKSHLTAIQQKFGVTGRVLIAVIVTRAQYALDA